MMTLKLLSIVFLIQLIWASNGQHLSDRDSGINCDGLQCPKEAKVCLVKKDSIQNTDRMTVERTCKGSDGMLC